MEQIRSLSCLLSFFLLSSISHAQAEWKLRKEVDGIKVYTRSVDNSKFDEYKVESSLQGSLHQIMSIFKDFSIYPKLFPESSEHKALTNQEKSHIIYMRMNAPFPATDRDGIFKNTYNYDRTTQHLHAEVECLKDTYQTKEGLIRVIDCNGSWDFFITGKDQLSVSHQFFADPRGFAPAFIVNNKTVNNPIKSIQQLKILLKDSKYNHRRFDFIEDSDN